MGPGTHIFSRVERGVQPSDQADLASMIHDVNYALANGNADKLDEADQKALNRLSYLDKYYYLMYLGFKARKMMNLYVGKVNDIDRDKAFKAKHIILSSPLYTKYEISDKDFIY
jgi:hypothetical protein